MGLNLRDLVQRDGFQQGTLGQDVATPRRGPSVPASAPRMVAPTDTTLAVLQALLALEQQKVPVGILVSVNLTVVTPQIRQTFNPLVMQLLLINDSASTIQYRVPDDPSGTWTNLQTAESQSIGFDYPVIATLGLRPIAGTNTLLCRVIGLR